MIFKQCVGRVRSLSVRAWVFCGFYCVSITLCLAEGAVAAASMVGGLQGLGSLLSGLHDMKSSVVELRDGYVSIEDIVDAAVANDVATVTSTAIDNPSVSLEPDARMDGCSTMNELIDSIGNSERHDIISSPVEPKDSYLSIEASVDMQLLAMMCRQSHRLRWTTPLCR